MMKTIRFRPWLYGLWGAVLVVCSAGCLSERETALAETAAPSSPTLPAADLPTEPKEEPVTPETPGTDPQADRSSATSSTQLATFGAGCFWCVEAVFQQLEGVHKVESGYAGGHVANPTYEQVCSKTTGHAEVCQITYDPQKIRYEELLEVFWKTHDPTTPNQQGYDIGPQYRSAIFFHDDRQRELAEKYKAKLDQSGAFNAPIVTEIVPYKNYYKAEGYHQNYFLDNPGDRYCRAIIQPKVEKFRQVFADKLKDSK
jgi:peptide-methionine (S)-S-oxide reductase